MGEPGADAGKSICGDVNEQRSNEEGESEEQSERVADEQGEREEAARKRNWTLRVERLGEGEGREDSVGEVGGLEEGVVGEEVFLDRVDLGDEVWGREEVDEPVPRDVSETGLSTDKGTNLIVHNNPL